MGLDRRGWGLKLRGSTCWYWRLIPSGVSREWCGRYTDCYSRDVRSIDQRRTLWRWLRVDTQACCALGFINCGRGISTSDTVREKSHGLKMLPTAILRLSRKLAHIYWCYHWLQLSWGTIWWEICDVCEVNGCLNVGRIIVRRNKRSMIDWKAPCHVV